MFVTEEAAKEVEVSCLCRRIKKIKAPLSNFAGLVCCLGFPFYPFFFFFFFRNFTPTIQCLLQRGPFSSPWRTYNSIARGLGANHFIMQEIGEISKKHTYKNKKGEDKPMSMSYPTIWKNIENIEKYRVLCLEIIWSSLIVSNLLAPFFTN